MKQPKPKPIVGQVVYCIPSRSAYGNKKLIPVVVKSVGRKYFCCGLSDSQHYSEYQLDDWSEKTRYTPDTYLYESAQEYEDEKEHSTLLREVREVFRGYSEEDLSLDQLRTIKNIIDGGGKE